MQKRAKFLYADRGVLWYEYRGKDYAVNTELYTSTAQQHKQEQLRIDAEIEREEAVAKREAGKERKYEDTVEYGLEVFFESVN